MQPDPITILLTLALLLVVYLIVRSFFQRVIIYEYQRGVKFRLGRFDRILEPGRYRFLKGSVVVQVVDMREFLLPVLGQEVLTADAVAVRISISARYQVGDPQRSLTQTEDATKALYNALQLALRQTVGVYTVEELVEKRPDLSPRLLELATPAADSAGLKLLSADIRDLMLTGETKKLFTQILKARKEGQAALERARGETAALRSLANVARIMESHPSLLQLRALQQLADSSGNTLVLGMPANTTLLPNPNSQNTLEEPSADSD
jgi:regulator of protease activity HflC (stomatin/prohibitin superfamily)